MLVAMAQRNRKGKASVEVQRTAVDVNGLAWSTFARLFRFQMAAPIADAELEDAFRYLIRQRNLEGTVYVNPMFEVRCSEPTQEFFAAALRAQRAYLSYLKSFLFKSGTMKREMRQRTPLLRQLEFTGVMIVNGRQVRPDQWAQRATPGRRPFRPARDLSGQRFGRLAIVEYCGKQKWLCRCRCGNTKVVRGHHLRSGRTTSCGCRGQELATKYENRKASRMR